VGVQPWFCPRTRLATLLRISAPVRTSCCQFWALVSGHIAQTVRLWRSTAMTLCVEDSVAEGAVPGRNAQQCHGNVRNMLLATHTYSSWHSGCCKPPCTWRASCQPYRCTASWRTLFGTGDAASALAPPARWTAARTARAKPSRRCSRAGPQTPFSFQRGLAGTAGHSASSWCAGLQGWLVVPGDGIDDGQQVARGL
jgi:hypothetical protein